MQRNYHTLDAILLVACLFMMTGVGTALVFVKVPQENLPILAGLASGIVGSVITAYVGARWGNKKPGGDEPVGSITVNPPVGGSASASTEAPPQ